jgi:hypothetical protein
MSRWARSYAQAAATVLALAAVPILTTPGVAGADVCASAGRRVSVSGCANIADTVAAYAPPPAYYAPMPEDFAPPPPPPVSVCASVGRRISVSGCT